MRHVVLPANLCKKRASLRKKHPNAPLVQRMCVVHVWEGYLIVIPLQADMYVKMDIIPHVIVHDMRLWTYRA